MNKEEMIVNMAAAHLENVKQKINELRNEQQMMEVEINKLISYYEANSKILYDESLVKVEKDSN